MPHEMTTQLAIGSFPTAERLCLGRQTCIHAKVVQEPVGIENLQIFEIGFLRVFENSGEEPHLCHLKVRHFRWRFFPSEADRLTEGRHFRRQGMPLGHAGVLWRRVSVLGSLVSRRSGWRSGSLLGE